VAPSEALVQEMMLQLARMDPDARGNVAIALAAIDASKEMEGLSVTMAPAMAEIVGAINRDPSVKEGFHEAFSRLEKLKKQREPPKGKVPTELSVLVFWTPDEQPSEFLAAAYINEVIAARYGLEPPTVRDFRLANLTDQEAGGSISLDTAHLFYSLAVERGGIVPDFGTPNDAHSGRMSNGTPYAALYFWHESKKARGAKKKIPLFGRS
jgi:hypothetical protein